MNNMPVITDSHHPGQCLRDIPACPPGRSCPGEPHHVQARARRPLCSHRRGGEWRERVQQQHQHRLQRDHLQRERSKLQFEWKSQQLEASALCAKTTSVRRLKPLPSLPPNNNAPLPARSPLNPRCSRLDPFSVGLCECRFKERRERRRWRWRRVRPTCQPAGTTSTTSQSSTLLPTPWQERDMPEDLSKRSGPMRRAASMRGDCASSQIRENCFPMCIPEINLFRSRYC